MMKKTLKNSAKFTISVLLVICLTSCGYFDKNSTNLVTKTGFYLDTVISVTLYEDDSHGIIDECFELCKNYETMFSKTAEGGELYNLNHSGSAVVSDELLYVIKSGIYYSQLSGGKFDITLGAVSDMYGFSSGSPALPSEEKISAALEHTGSDKIIIEGNTVTITDPETEIDLGSIAKGYIADKLKDHLIARGVESAIINLGGNVVCVGGKPDGSDFLIGIQYPFEDTNKTITNVQVSDSSVVTSGIYERSFEENGKLYHHILDPETGYPFDNGILAVSIISEKSIDGDAMSTVAFALGVEDGLALINSLDGIYGVYVTDDYKLHYSDGFEELFCS